MDQFEVEAGHKSSTLNELLIQGNLKELYEIIQEMPVVEVCDFLNEREEKDILAVLDLFPKAERGHVFSHMEQEAQLKIFHFLDKMNFAPLFTHMDSDIRADLYQELNQKDQVELLPFLSKKIREDVISLSSYPTETAGGVMSTDFATVYNDMTAAEAIAKIREDAPSQKMIYYVYVVDHLQRMIGLVTLKDLIMADPKEVIEEILQEFFVYADVNEDRESVAQKIDKYSLVAIPVLNPFKQLVGIVSHDDAIEIIQDEHTEDMEKFMAMTPTKSDDDYLSIPSFTHFKSRVVWIVALAAIGIISGMIIHQYEDILTKFLILAIYMPMMAATGGNSGSQSATLVIRALALGEVSIKDWWKIIFKEIKISFMISICVAMVIFIKIYFFTFASAIPQNISLELIGFTISLSLALQVVSSAIIGSGLPLIVRKLGGDPAVAASPAITTAVDITGLLIYFTTATLLLNI
jgi:magnesium transporter